MTRIVKISDVVGGATINDSVESAETVYSSKKVASLIPGVSGKADKTNVLELNNTTAFTPDADYEPATKKYVDDNATADLPIQIDAATAKTPLVDTDTFALTEPTTLKKTLWSTIKSTLKTYFDGLYLALSGGTLSGGLTIYGSDAVYKIRLGYSADYRWDIQKEATPTLTFGYWQFGVFQGKVSFTYTGGIQVSNTSNGGLNIAPWGGGGNAVNFNPTKVNGAIYFGRDTTLIGTYFETGKVGIGTIAPDKQLEINSADGNCLRLTYNDANGSAAYYADFNISSAGVLTINASGNIIKTANDVEITDSTKGIILTSPDSSRWRVTVGNDGVLTTTEI